jgi:hypothetical protein
MIELTVSSAKSRDGKFAVITIHAILAEPDNHQRQAERLMRLVTSAVDGINEQLKTPEKTEPVEASSE